MLTLFTIPKPFEGHNGLIQRNALETWARLPGDCQIVVCGDEPGARAAAESVGADFVAELDRSNLGTPLLSSAFAAVRKLARHRLMCYVNADIILLDDFIAAVSRVPKRQFLMIGQRVDIDLTRPWDFAADDWSDQLRAYIAEHGALHAPSGSDYFVFPRDHTLADIPAFAVGRPGWDNWFIYRARQLRLPVVDATPSTVVIHQNHDYRHVPQAVGRFWEGPEGDRNLALAGGYAHVFTLDDATHVLTPRGLRRAWDARHLRRRWRTLPTLFPFLQTLRYLWQRVLVRLRRARGLRRLQNTP